MGKNWISKLSHNIPMKLLHNNKFKKKNDFKLIKSLIEIYIKYCQKLDFEVYP